MSEHRSTSLETSNLEIVTPESLDSVLREINKGISTAERETIIRKAQDEDNWTIHSDDPIVVRKLIKRYTCYRTSRTGQLSFVVPTHCVSFRQLEKLSGGKGNPEALKRAREKRSVQQ